MHDNCAQGPLKGPEAIPLYFNLLHCSVPLHLLLPLCPLPSSGPSLNHYGQQALSDQKKLQD